jgi:hypothetical protein
MINSGQRRHLLIQTYLINCMNEAVNFWMDNSVSQPRFPWKGEGRLSAVPQRPAVVTPATRNFNVKSKWSTAAQNNKSMRNPCDDHRNLSSYDRTSMFSQLLLNLFGTKHLVKSWLISILNKEIYFNFTGSTKSTSTKIKRVEIG